MLKEFKEELKSLIHSGEIHSVWMDSNVREETLGDIWYGGLVLAFTYHNLKFRLDIIGEVRGRFSYTSNGKLVEEEVIDKNEDGLLGKLLHQAGFYKDSDVEAKVNLDLFDNNWADLTVYNYKIDEYYDVDCCSLYDVISGGVQSLLDGFQDVVDVNYQSKEDGSSYEFLERLEYEKYCEYWCKGHKYPYEDLPEALANNGFNGESPASFKEWRELDNNTFNKTDGYTIEAMFKALGVSKVFKKDGTFTKAALKVYDEVSSEFFDGITDNLDELCEEELCF
jgi:hypothetical protein